MEGQYDPAAELADIAAGIDARLADPTASGLSIATVAAARIRTVAERIRTAQDQAMARAATMPPVRNEEQALSLPAVLAAEDAYAADPGPGKMVPLNRAILTEACEAAGVTLGGFDGFIIQYLARVNPTTCAVVAGWITRAAAGAGR